MKKYIIWLLTIVMSITFGALLYFQIIYLENMVKMREAQFSEMVMQCLSNTSSYLEKMETLHFLQQDINILESGISSNVPGLIIPSSPFGNVGGESIGENNLGISGEKEARSKETHVPLNQMAANLSGTYRNMQEVLRGQYLYQRGLLNEIILSILRESGKRPVYERADSDVIKSYLSNQLQQNGLDLPFTFAVANSRNTILYSTSGYDRTYNKGIYTQTLFPNTDTQLKLNVEFPTKNTYIFSSVRFIIPSLAFTLILLVVFVFTIVMAFRQKKLSEMKTDFINNMTHELKTPISTISLAAQMLNDDSVRKSPASLKHLSQVIGDESKRLRFQVEKVLQMSVFDNSSSSLKFITVDANAIIENVVHTFRIKVEKYGGSITCDLRAKDALINVDEMHFTNIIYNLLDNAVKYMREEIKPELKITTSDIGSKDLKIEIEDNGIGIKKDDQKKIFDKFFRVHTGNRHDVKGFGLGLAYVKKMVTIFNGDITVESELGKGSTFIITLPLEN